MCKKSHTECKQLQQSDPICCQQERRKLLPTTNIPEVNGHFAATALADDSSWL